MTTRSTTVMLNAGYPAWRSPELRELVALAAGPTMAVVPAFETRDERLAYSSVRGARWHAVLLVSHAWHICCGVAIVAFLLQRA
jgi:hypothetical protein